MAATTEAPRKEQPAAPKGAASSGLDTMLTDATRGPLRRLLPGRAAVKLAAKLGTRPDTVVTRGAQLAAELAKVGLGRSELEPAKGDRRFKDDAWRGNPAFKRLLQSYLATGQALDGLIDDAGLDWRSERQVRFAVENVLDALAPSNAPLTNPAVLKAALDTGGRNFARGAANFARDMSKPPRIPSMVDTSAFTVGEDIAVTPGQIVLRIAGVRADPVQAADLEGARAAAAAHAADDQQVLHRRPGAGPQHDGVRGQAGPAGVRDLLAQPDGEPRGLGPRHLRAARCSRRSTPSRRSPAPTRRT